MGTHPRLPGLTDDRPPLDGTADGTPPAGSSRRSFLAKVAVGGAALTVGSQLLPAGGLLPTAAQEDGGETDGIDTLGPDDERLRFLATVALAGAAAYEATLALDVSLPETVVATVRRFGSHHSQQADALGGLLPVEIDQPNPSVLAAQSQALAGAGDLPAVLGVLRELEDAVAATHLAALGVLEDGQARALVATALPVCAQHATVLGSLQGADPADLLPEEQTTDGELTEADNPVGDAPQTGGPTEVPPTEGGEGPDQDGEGGTGQPGDGTQQPGGGATEGDGGTGDDPQTPEG